MPKRRWNTTKPISIDGRTLEGGGQLVRNALCLSALTAIPIHIHHIRGNRSGGGGLKAQHLACVNWLARACSARVQGAEKGSTTLTFEPGKAEDTDELIAPSPLFKKVMTDDKPIYECRLDIETAGSTCLALQAILPFILFSNLPLDIPIRLTLTGGTNVSASPSYEYVSQVLLPTLGNIGFPKIKATLEQRGWSHGGSSVGSFTLHIHSRKDSVLPAFRLRPEKEGSQRPQHLHATFIAPESCHNHFRNTLFSEIQQTFGSQLDDLNNNLTITCEPSYHEKRMYLILVATMIPNDRAQPAKSYRLARDWLYDRKIRSHQRVTTEMVQHVTSELNLEVISGACVDERMRDQLVIFQALADGESEVYPGDDVGKGPRYPSLHAQTAMWIATEMLDIKFKGQTRCVGVGFTRDEAESRGEIPLEERVEKMLSEESPYDEVV